MHSLVDNPALLRFTLAGALALTAAACSRSDRSDAGRGTSETASVGPSDSQAAGQADTATTGAATETTRSAPSAAPEKENVSGYQPMAASGVASQTTAAGVASDTGSQVSGDTTTGAAVMARDTSTVLAQGDISAQRSEVTVETADTTESIHVQIDTATAESPAEIAQAASADTAAVAAAQVPSTGNIATGPEAVALISREGRRCTVVDPDRSQDAQWDLASSPATMNPCGTGTMTLPRVQTEK
jgi:hypothetical protein